MSQVAAEAAPIEGSDRLALLDFLRGLALFGVLFANLPFHYQGPLLDPVNEPFSGADDVTTHVLGAIFVGKFYVLFSLLFGYGLAVQYARALRRSENYLYRYGRRLFGLMVLGVLHGTFVFDGDILLAYGLLGIALPLLLPVSKRGLVICATALLVIGVVVLTGWEALLTASPQEVAAVATATETISYAESVQSRAITMSLQLLGLFVVGWHVLGMFVVGLLVAKEGWLTNQTGSRRTLKIWRGPFFFAGLVLTTVGGWIVGAFPSQNVGTLEVVGTALNALGGPLFALGLIGWSVRWMQRHERNPVSAVLQAVGRMSLTCYLLQSIVMFALLSPWTLGLAQQWSLMETIPLALFAYLGIAGFAAFWLQHFRFGPVEWLLRSWTYWQVQPLRGKAR